MCLSLGSHETERSKEDIPPATTSGRTTKSAAHPYRSTRPPNASPSNDVPVLNDFHAPLSMAKFRFSGGLGLSGVRRMRHPASRKARMFRRVPVLEA